LFAISCFCSIIAPTESEETSFCMVFFFFIFFFLHLFFAFSVFQIWRGYSNDYLMTFMFLVYVALVLHASHFSVCVWSLSNLFFFLLSLTCHFLSVVSHQYNIKCLVLVFSLISPSVERSVHHHQSER
jgi:hypothetical protein